MKRILALIYKSYESRNLDIAYFRALMTIIGPLVFIIALEQRVLEMQLLNAFSTTLKCFVVSGALFVCLLFFFLVSIKRKN